jgi:hypothetical protein
MANVAAVYEVPEGLAGGASVENRDGTAATRVFQVEFDDFNPFIWAALDAESPKDPIPADECLRIPRYGEAHPEDTFSVMVSKSAVPDPEGADTWRVTCQYKYPTLDTNNGGSPPDPTNSELGDGQTGSTGGTEKTTDVPEPLPNQKRSIGTFTRQKAWEKDLEDLLIKNSAGDPYDPPIVTEQPLSEFTFVRSQTTFKIGWKLNFEGTINRFAYLLKIGDSQVNCAARTLKIAKISAEEVPATERTQGYWMVTIVLQYDPQGWQPAPLDMGFREQVGGVMLDIFDAGGTKVVKPALLDGAGAKLAVAGTPVFLNGVAPSTFGPFIVYEERDFKWLALSN